MFCGECGAKLKKGAQFCEECGAPVPEADSKKEEDEKQETAPVTPKEPRKPMSKKTKIGLIVGGVVLVVLVAGYMVLSNQYSPNTVALEYVDAVIHQDANRLYSYLNLGSDTTFVSKDKFVEHAEESKGEDLDVAGCTVTNVRYGSTNTNATVTVKCALRETGEEDSINVKLVKDGKALLLFDQWKVALDTDDYVVKDYEMKVPKGAKISIDGVDVADKYLDKKDSTESQDVYKIPVIFTMETPIKVSLANGFVIEDDVTPSSYDDYEAELSLDELTSDQISGLQDQIKTDVNTLYQNILAKKTWTDVKSSYQYGDVTLSDFEDTYTDLYDDVVDSSYRQLTAFDVTSVRLSSVELNDEGRIEIYCTINYKYSTSYENYSGEVQTRDSNDYFYTTMTYDFLDNAYHLYDMSNTETYFY